MSLSRTILLLLIGVAFSPLGELRAAETAEFRAALESIRDNRLKNHVEVLAGDSFEGREAGSRGGRAAAGYLRDRLKKWGLKGGGDNGSFFQFFGRNRNVIAKLAGSDPELAGEFIVVGAHYDHVGYGSAVNSYGPTGYIHNGADDNASGTAALLEVAHAYANLPTPPKRSLVFIFFDGEEKGLLGSKHWVSSPTVPLKQVKAMINMDMVGRLRRDKVEVYGTRTSAGLRRLVSDENRELALRLDFPWVMKSNSDHHTFFRRSIPALMFHTGLHDNYHRPSDDAHLVNVPGIRRVAQLAFRTSHVLADQEASRGFRSASRTETNYGRTRLEKAYAKRPPRLGITWAGFDPEQGLTVSRITADSAAAKSGLLVGDRVTALNGRSLSTPGRFRSQVLAAPIASTLTVVRSGEEQPLELPVSLVGNPVRVGFSWRTDAAEGSSVVVVNVIAGSAAEAAGLRRRDRVYQINGNDFSDSKDLKRLLAESPGPLDLLIERQGRTKTIKVNVE